MFPLRKDTFEGLADPLPIEKYWEIQYRIRMKVLYAS